MFYIHCDCCGRIHMDGDCCENKVLDTDKTIPKLIGCARCGQTHFNLVFKKFKFPPEWPYGSKDSGLLMYTHFCLCPTNQEPILLRDE